MKKIIILAFASPLLSGCITSHFVRTDGRPIGDAATTAQFEIDKKICSGEAQQAFAAGWVNPYANNPVIAEKIGLEACMARRGYLATTKEKAESLRRQLQQSAPDRERIQNQE